MRSRGVTGRVVRGLATLVFTGLCAWYIVAKIDLAKTGDLLSGSRFSLLALALAILVLALVPLAWRWQRLLAVRGIHERLPWLLRAYFVSYTAGQILPTSLGGDAMRIFETTRRHRGAGGPVAGRCCSSGASAASRRCCSARSASRSPSAATTSARTSGSSC